MSHNAHVTTKGCNYRVFSWMKDRGGNNNKGGGMGERTLYFACFYFINCNIVIVAMIWHVYGIFFL